MKIKEQLDRVKKLKNLSASREHSHRALRAPFFLDLAHNVRSYAFRIHLGLFIII